MPDDTLRFGPFTLDRRAGELRRDGAPLKLAPQPFKVLEVLASRAGSVVTRDELRREVWGTDVVDFEHGLNFCILQVRAALGDDAQNPTYVRTIPRRGYQFVAPVSTEPPPASAVPDTPPAPVRRPFPTARLTLLGLLGIGLVAGAFLLPSIRRPGGPPLSGRSVLAVLPFENLDGREDEEYFADGLTEELITRLGRLDPERLGVIARTSVMKLKGNRADLSTLGARLGVDHVLEGSVRHGAGRMRVTVQLIRLSDQTHLWAETYDRPRDDALAVQDDVAGRVARSLAGRLLPAALPSRPAASPAAYDAFLKGRTLVARGGPGGLAEAVRAFESSLALEPQFARAHAALADALHQLRMRDSLPPRTVYPRAEAAARRAVELDDSLAEGHAALGAVLLWYRWDAPAARLEFRRALALNPSLAAALHDLAFLVAGDEPDEAVSLIRRASELDPLSARANVDVGWIYLRTGRYDDALGQCSRTLRLEPGFGAAEACVAEAHLRRGEVAEAFRFTRALLARTGATPEELAGLDAVPPAEGLRRARALRLERLKARAATGYVSGYALAVEQAALGDAPAAVASLRTAFDAREGMLYRIETDPAFESLRSDPGFVELAQKVRLAGEP